MERRAGAGLQKLDAVGVKEYGVRFINPHIKTPTAYFLLLTYAEYHVYTAQHHHILFPFNAIDLSVRDPYVLTMIPPPADRYTFMFYFLNEDGKGANVCVLWGWSL